MSNDRSGPAFPVSTSAPEGHQDGPSTWQFPGMSLRDYFAAQAIPAVIDVCREDVRQDGVPYVTYCADMAYAVADAMLKAREA